MPPEVSRLAQAVVSVPGVTNAEIGKLFLGDIEASQLSLAGPYADLPIAAMRRTNGGLPNEVLLSINFTIDRNEDGLKALEFLAWWVRDGSRGGETMQLRPIGLPPIAGERIQLGQTLRFTIDWFYSDASEDITEIFAEMNRVSDSLETSTELYKSAF